MFIENTKSAESKTASATAHNKIINLQSDLFINKLAVQKESGTIKIWCSTRDAPGRQRVKSDQLPENVQSSFDKVIKKDDYIYYQFYKAPDCKVFSIPSDYSTGLQCTYFTHLLRMALKDHVSFIENNFLHDTTVWIADKAASNPQISAYKRFVLRIEGNLQQPVLLISYEGKSFVCTKSWQEMQNDEEYDQVKIHTITFRQRLYPSLKAAPDEVYYHKDEVYPVLNSSMPINKPYEKNPNRLGSYKSNIEAFKKEYIEQDSFQKVLPTAKQWIRLQECNTGKLPHNSHQYVFGQGRAHSDIYQGLKQYGPYKFPKTRQLRSIIILPDGFQVEAKKLSQYLSAKPSDCHYGFNTLSRLENKFSTDRVIYYNLNDPIKNIRKALVNYQDEEGTASYAFVISPYSALTTSAREHGQYYKIKEELLRHGIVSQHIAGMRVRAAESLNYWVVNIAIAALGKLGGIPWRLNHPVEDELIIGFGAIRNGKQKYVGSTLMFNNEGIVADQHCFPATETYALAAQAEKALRAYSKGHTEVKRMVIHFYKSMSRKELKPIEQMLARLKFDIPIIVIGINKYPSRSCFAFNMTGDALPQNGRYVKAGYDKYLLYMNTKQNEHQVNAAPLPLNLRIKSNDLPELYKDEKLIQRLMQQLYDFSHMHWRSVKQKPLPVTVFYAELLASHFAHFESEVLEGTAKSGLWML